MRKRGLVVILLVACSESRGPVVTSAVDTRPDAASMPTASVDATASATPPPSSSVAPEGLGSCAGAIADAQAKDKRGWKEDPRELDVDGDGTHECVLRSCYGGNCDLVIYRREGGGVRRIGEMTASFVSSPYCVDKPSKGTFCRLDVGVHMIHGETMPTYWKYVGGRYIEDGHGELIPGPSHHKPRHP